jgi:hypothetical protein
MSAPSAPPAPKRRRAARSKPVLPCGLERPAPVPPETDGLKPIASSDLLNEVAMLRVTMQRVFDLGKGAESPQEVIEVLKALGIAASRLAGLIKVQRDIAGNDPIAEAITQALAEVNKELIE